MGEDTRELGQVAFETYYGEFDKTHATTGMDLTEDWHRSSPEARAMWNAAAEAVVTVAKERCTNAGRMIVLAGDVPDGAVTIEAATACGPAGSCCGDVCGPAS